MLGFTTNTEQKWGGKGGASKVRIQHAQTVATPFTQMVQDRPIRQQGGKKKKTLTAFSPGLAEELELVLGQRVALAQNRLTFPLTSELNPLRQNPEPTIFSYTRFFLMLLFILS